MEPSVYNELQQLTSSVGLPSMADAVTPYRLTSPDDPPPGCMPCASWCPPEEEDAAGANYSYRWTRDGKLKLKCPQPVVPVPVLQEVHRRDKIIEIPHIDVVDAIKPKVYNQGVQHDVPNMRVTLDEKVIEIPNVKIVEREVVVPVVTGYTHKFVPKWEIREVPRPVVKYIGEQELIEVEVPQVKFVDKIVEREVVVDTIEKKVPKIIEVPKYVEQVKYVWKPMEKIVHRERFVPKFDVAIECPAPLIVPYPVQSVKEMPAVMMRKSPGDIGVQEIDIQSPAGTVRVPQEYIKEYAKAKERESSVSACSASEAQEPSAPEGSLPMEPTSPEESSDADELP